MGTDLVADVGEQAALAAEVVRHPLVTLVGSDDGAEGSDSAHRAAGLGRRLEPNFPDGVCWVDLRWVPAAVVAERVALAVGAATNPRQPAELGLTAHLRDRRALLVWEGCDRVRRTCAELAGVLRRCCPALRLLATGSGPLGADAEVVRSLRVAVAGSGPVAAAADRTYQRFTAATRHVLASLASFRGGFTIEDAEAVVGADVRPVEVRRAVAELCDSAWVKEDVRPFVGRATVPRLEVPEGVRRFLARQAAAGQIDAEQTAAARDRHATYWASVAADAESGLSGRDQAHWLSRLARHRDDLAAALDRLTGRGDTESALRMAGALGRFWWLSGSFGEGQRALHTVLTVPGAARPTAGRAAALHALGLATFWHETEAEQAARSGANFAEAVEIYRRLDDPVRLARAARDLASHLNSTGDACRARRLLIESVTIARRHADAVTIGVGLSYLGILACYVGDRVQARAHLEEAVVLLCGQGGDDEVVRAQFFLACLECDEGNAVAARARFVALVGGRRLVPALGYATGFALDGLARLAAVEGRFADALQLSGAAAKTHRRLGTSAGPGYAAYVHRGLDAAWRACGDQAAAWVEQGRGWTLDRAVERGLARPQPVAEPLREREIDVLRLAETGMGDLEIARALFLSPRTVGNHLSSAYRRLGVHSRTAAVRQARQLGLL